MTRIVCAEDCGNAPKKQFVKDFNIAFARADIPALLAMMTDDAEWNIVGAQAFRGKDAIQDEFKRIGLSPAEELVLENIISHGKLCAANGVLTQSSAPSLAFCSVYVFSSAAKDAKIKTITSYGIPVTAT